MSQIVLRNLECFQVEEKLSEVLNADEVIGGFDIGSIFAPKTLLPSINISNSNTNVDTTIRNVLNINRDLPLLQAINQIA